MFKITNLHVAAIAILLFGYGVIKVQSARIDGLKSDIQTIEQVSKQQNEAIKQLKTDYSNIMKYDEQRKENQAEADTSNAKMTKDSKRENVVKAKPKLVEKQINESFNKFALDLQETTR